MKSLIKRLMAIVVISLIIVAAHACYASAHMHLGTHVHKIDWIEVHCNHLTPSHFVCSEILHTKEIDWENEKLAKIYQDETPHGGAIFYMFFVTPPGATCAEKVLYIREQYLKEHPEHTTGSDIPVKVIIEHDHDHNPPEPPK